MRLRIKSKTPEATDKVKDYAEKKLENLGRNILEPPVEAVVEFAHQGTKSAKDRFVVQVTIDTKGLLLRGEERGPDFLTAIDNVAGVLKRQVEKYKGRRSEKGKAVEKGQAIAEESAREPGEKVVKFKRFALRPMSLDEAIEQMELLGHNFFAFVDAGTGKTNILYRRRDGNYGQIQLDVM